MCLSISPTASLEIGLVPTQLTKRLPFLPTSLSRRYDLIADDVGAKPYSRPRVRGATSLSRTHR